MANTRLLLTACTVALLGAAPAFAQTNTPTGDTGAGGAPNNPTAHETMPNRAGNMAPADRMGSMSDHDSRATMDSHMSHRSTMAHPMNGKSDTSQEAAVDQLNEQSYQAARSGQAFNGSGSAGNSGGMPAPRGSGTMNDMSGGSMSGHGSMGSGGKM